MSRTRTDGPDEFEPSKFDCRYICLHVTYLHLFLSLQEAIVSQLFTRYSQGQIYTYIGDILLAVNPFSTLTIYNEEVGILTCMSIVLSEKIISIKCPLVPFTKPCMCTFLPNPVFSMAPMKTVQRTRS